MTSGNEIQSLKHLEPSSLLVQVYVAVLMRVTFGGFFGFTGRMGFRGSGIGFGVSMEGADNGGVWTEGELLDLCCDG